MSRRPPWLWFIVLLGVWTSTGLSGCTAPSASPTRSALTSSPVRATYTPSPTPSPAPSPTPVPSPTRTTTPTATPWLQDALSPTDRAAFAGETYPDYTRIQPGATFVKVWRLTNTGTRAWGPGYFLHREAVQGAPLAPTDSMPLEHTVAPGETAAFEVSMTAPEEPGIYSERWTLRDPQGHIVPVDGGRYVWVIIRACAEGGPCPQPPTPVSTGGQSQTAQQVTLQLLDFTTTSDEVRATVCIVNPPTPRHVPFVPITLYLDERAIDISGQVYVRPGCYVLTFPAAPAEVQAARAIRLVIGQIRILGGPPNPNEACEQARTTLQARYPGLDFTCQFSMAGYYVNLRLPAGMTREQADQLIVDTIEQAIYGPWEFQVR